MFKKAAVAMAAIMALAMFQAGCGAAKESSITLDISDEKTATIELSNAKEDEFVQSGCISVAEGEGIEIVSDLNDGGKVLIGFIEVEEDQNIDELPDRENAKYEMMITGEGTEGATLDTGDYDLKVTVQGKATGSVTLSVKPAGSITGMVVAEDSENAAK